MKKVTTATLVLTLTLLVSGLAFAMDMSHGDMKAGDMTPAQSMKVMEENLQMMKMDVEAMKDPAGREAAMKAMDKHMTDMHHGMAGMEAHAKKQGDAGMQAHMSEMNKEMMTTMKGMGVMKKDADKGMSMMMEGINQMEQTMSKMKGMM
ncbi:hypothetical protein [Pseudodesulfovibrio indicus]|uniref:Uncharacterized protein n=1 Tax=Pseudodesulfovibrio indicus TaxID=1716143 RepID=A0A126QM75_9BACT|nr:hypothetical protein [Pseudodesulfovibrio indicus]AMK10798.1 hypothetical protein AWY79_06585 [Pseudodesulfovibrio indicus]TDT91786.1 hypothetical protein EDC59_101186 [Pseudodesulfovibrio indicus]